MNPRLSMRRSFRHVTVAVLVLGMPMMLHAQEKPAEGEQTAEEQMLDDFGSGLRAIAWAQAEEDLDLAIDMDLKELWAIAADAMLPEKADLGMELYLEDYEANQQMSELDVFRDGLKSNVMDGSMSRDEALAAWVEVMDVRFFHDFKGTSSTEWTTRLKDSADRGLLGAIRLRVPDAGNVRILTRPEFLARDLQYLGRELELDEQTRSIIKLLLEDYVRTYEARSTALMDAIRSARRGMARQERRVRVTRARTNMNELVDSVDWDLIRASAAEKIEDDQKRMWMTQAIDRFQGSIGEIQGAIEVRQRELDQDTGSYMDPSEVLELAAALQQDRPRIRADLIEAMRLVLNEERQAELDRIFERFILEQARTDSRMGGSRINLQLALQDALQDEAMTTQDRALLDEATVDLLELADQWTNARIDRERSGLELFVAYQDDNDSSKERLTRIHAGRARAELESEVAIRDRLLAGQLELEESLQKRDPSAAARFRERSTQQGFAPQVRERWSERAIAAALGCEELRGDQREMLEEYEVDVASQLEPLRTEAIRTRVSIEPRVARVRIDSMTGKVSTSSLGLEGWEEPNAAGFRAINKDVADRLAGMFEGAACIELVPRRRGDVNNFRNNAKEASKAVDKGDAAGTKGGSGEGRGRRGRGNG